MDGDGGMTYLYRCIRLMFRASAGVFYATTEVHGLDNLPPAGVPTILCFNHGNGLADPLVLIRTTPRMVRFCAKDTLWSIPIMKYFIRNSGAVPVYRRREHGDEAEKRNLDVFKTVIAALRQGACLGFAPEGVSRFLPYMEQPLKTGVARIAIEAVQLAEQAGQPNFGVRLAPVGLIFTHREKFRSDLCIRYCEPILVDKEVLHKYNDLHAAARDITQKLSTALEAVTINAPDWETTRLAITAVRLHCPAGTDFTLGQYLTLLRGWVEVLKLGETAEQKQLKAALKNYQDLLDAKKIKCERVRRAQAVGQALPWYWCAWGMFQRLMSALVLSAFAAPGLILWRPVWLYLKRRERFLLAKGPRWNDSVAETKMLISFFVVSAFAVCCVAAGVLLWSPWPPMLLVYLYLTMRCYEEAVADLRSAYTLYKLLFLTPKTMAAMVERRKAALAELEKSKRHLPPSVGEYINMSFDEALPTRSLDYYFPWWLARLLMLFYKRQKKDWNEVLRLSDYGTMDYIE
ncbi:hypothetical protein AB1Y20_009059 [Prymnesium parvum]|uniref:Phospholipid/glycerol acyltransferase domain-containing protein n=1 Tax=Prymnesium parvum TaxID=97485 RepID=A0AB34JZN5_PRYPA